MSNNTTADVTGIFSLDTNRLVGLAAKGSPDVTFLAGQDTPTSGIPLTATLSDGGIEMSESVLNLPGAIPRDVPDFMFARPTGPEVGFAVPNPYAGYKDEAVVHPSICYVPEGFAGYKFWLAYTPYPNNESGYENPCVVVSNRIDGGYVNAPGTTNPVDSRAVQPSYNRDSHIYYDRIGKQMVLIWNQFGFPASNKITIFVSTHNGSGWSYPVGIYEGTVLSTDIVAPSIWYNDVAKKWEIIGVNPDTPGHDLMKITSDSLLSGWTTTATILPLNVPAGRNSWHSSLLRLDSGRIIGLMQDTPTTGSGWVNLLMSKNGAEFEMAPIKIEGDQGRTTGRWYRSTLTAIERYGDIELWAIYSIVGSKKLFAQRLKVGAVSYNRNTECMRVGSMLSAAKAGAASGLIAADDFARADAADGLGSDLLGNVWAQVYPSNPIGILGSKAYNATSGNCVATIDAGTTSYSASVTFASPGSEGYLVVRKSATEFWRFGVISSTLVQLQRFNSAVDMQPMADLGILRPLAKPGDIFRIDVSGRSAQFFLNGKLLYTADGTVFPNTTIVGIQASGATATKFAGFILQSTANF